MGDVSPIRDVMAVTVDKNPSLFTADDRRAIVNGGWLAFQNTSPNNVYLDLQCGRAENVEAIATPPSKIPPH